jgi:glycosyltransferase involved in cell wall biosynthesis
MTMIVIDASPAVHHKAGLGRYAEELIAALVEDSRKGDRVGDRVGDRKGRPYNQYVAFYHDAANATPSKLIQSMTCIATDQTPYPWRLRALMAQLLNLSQDNLLTEAPSNTPRDQLDAPQLFHATEHLLPRFKTIKTVFTLHDLIFKFYPHYHLPRNRIFLTLAMPLFLRHADAIICVSENTRRDAQRVYRIPDEKTRVIYEGVHPRFKRVVDTKAIERARDRYLLPERYILSVGTIEPRKNLITLLEAYAALRAQDENFKTELIVVGKQGWLSEATYRAVHERGLTGLVRFIGYVEEDDLPAVYSLAQAFAFPSVYEGFGLPPLEALACGTPVVCSNASSLPEVVNDAALLVPPTDARAWTQTLSRVLADQALRADLSSRGPRQAARFTWEAAARATRRIYDELLT